MADLSVQKVFARYVSELSKYSGEGYAREHAYRPALQKLIESIDTSVVATNDPCRQDCGAPDFIVTRRRIPLGYIEAKDIGKELNDAESSDQLGRYFGQPNVLLTDYLEFRWYVTGQLREIVTVGSRERNGRIRLHSDGVSPANDLIQRFLNPNVPSVRESKDLAVLMAKSARTIQHAIREALKREHGKGRLTDQLRGFREVLLRDLDEVRFCDMYAQTICYGLFAARCNAARGESFSRNSAARLVPKTNPFLRKLFGEIAGSDIEDEPYVWAVDDLVTLLNRCEESALIPRTAGRAIDLDPVFHFYETFLAEYCPEERQRRGVYYTPPPVVSYIVRSIDLLLRDTFGFNEGLADSRKIDARSQDDTQCIHRVLILDPAAGTGTFLHEVIERIYRTLIDSGQGGKWQEYVREDLLPRVFGFELFIAPYAIAHMKLDLQLRRKGYKFHSNERLGVFMTNTLDQPEEMSTLPLFAFSRWIAEEADAARKIKQDYPVMVVLGNPPYSGESVNKGKWITQLLKGVDIRTGEKTSSYFEVNGEALKERNVKWLNDDYVKFIRFAQRRIEQTGYGILALVSNHGYLENPTFRGMRQSLLRMFDDIYILDLHGSLIRKETGPAGTKDENVFDIQQGVCIGIFVKRSLKTKRSGTIKQADLWGARERFEVEVDGTQKLVGGKYYWLSHNDVHTTQWSTIEPKAPFYSFTARANVAESAEYEGFWKLTDIFPLNSSGIVTARDALTIHFDVGSAWKAVRETVELDADELTEKYALGKDVRDWTVSGAKNDLNSSGPEKRFIVPILYRPFDIRHTYYTGRSRGFHCMPRREVMQHLVKGRNRALITTRQTRDKWDAFVASTIVAHKAVAAYDINSVFPLWIHEDEAARKLSITSGLQPNISSAFIADVEKRTGLDFVESGGDLSRTFDAENAFNYVYAILNSTRYRNLYEERLLTDFPRIPVTDDPALFANLCRMGAQLSATHLLTAEPAVAVGFPIAGTGIVQPGYPKFVVSKSGDARSGRVYISGGPTESSGQFFDNVPTPVFEHKVGGYQVCYKWLKDRVGKKLTNSDITHYQNIATAISATLDLRKWLDELIESSAFLGTRKAPKSLKAAAASQIVVA